MPNVVRLPRTKMPLTDIPFVYDSYRDLTAKLGAVDGHAASLAIATRFFAEQSSQQADQQAFGLSLAKTYKVSTRFIDLNGLPDHLHQLLIVGTTKHWEDFLTRFRREQAALGRNWRQRHDGEDRFSHILDCLDGGEAVNIRRIGKERYDLVEYYRLVRNATAHEFEKHARLKQEFDKVEQHRALVLEEYGLNAPNLYPQTTFDDHMLYTRVVKYIATDICRLQPPNSLFELKKILTDRSAFNRDPAFISKNKGDHQRLAKALSIFLKFSYNYRIDEPLLSQVLSWIDEIPTRKVRRRNKMGKVVDLLAENSA